MHFQIFEFIPIIIFLLLVFLIIPGAISCFLSFFGRSINKRPHRSILQRGSSNMIPRLRAQPFWNTALFPWVQELESHFERIKEEFMQLRDKGHVFQVSLDHFSRHIILCLPLTPHTTYSLFSWYCAATYEAI